MCSSNNTLPPARSLLGQGLEERTGSQLNLVLRIHFFLKRLRFCTALCMNRNSLSLPALIQTAFQGGRLIPGIFRIIYTCIYILMGMSCTWPACSC